MEQANNKPRELRKSDLAAQYGMHPKRLQKLMNGDFKEELELVGYHSRQITLSPRVVQRFYQLYGEPPQHQ